MKRLTSTIALALFAGAALAACGASPESTIEKKCIAFDDTGSDAKDKKAACSCLASELKKTMSEDDFKKIATAFKKAKTGDDLEEEMRAAGLPQSAMLQFAGAAKNCMPME